LDAIAARFANESNDEVEEDLVIPLINFGEGERDIGFRSCGVCNVFEDEEEVEEGACQTLETGVEERDSCMGWGDVEADVELMEAAGIAFSNWLGGVTAPNAGEPCFQGIPLLTLTAGIALAVATDLAAIGTAGIAFESTLAFV
jgi:hypothetical protein